MHNFILLSEKVISILHTKLEKLLSINCFFGDKAAFILVNNKEIKIYDAKEKQFKQKLTFVFHKKGYLKKSLELLKENGFSKYQQYFLLFNNDYTSPIFNKDNSEIGYAYLYSSKITDYSNYIHSTELEAFIKLYFNYAKIHTNNNILRNGKYVLINPDLINVYKTYYNYANLEQKLNSIPFVQQILSNMKIENGEKIIDDKKVCIIIKQFLPDMNQNFLSMTKNNKNFKIKNINEEPNIENIEGTKYLYYNNFEIIDEDIYELLIKNDDYAEYANYQECTFENNYMYFNIDDIFCKNKSTINIEICALNQNTNSFSANFIIENYYSFSFRKFLKIAELGGGLDKCLKSYEHNKLVEELIDNSTGQTIGVIYNLLYKANNNNFKNVNNILSFIFNPI